MVGEPGTRLDHLDPLTIWTSYTSLTILTNLTDQWLIMKIFAESALFTWSCSSLIVNNKMNFKTLIYCFKWCLPFVLFWRDHTDQAEGRELILRRSVTGRLTDCVPLWSNSYLLNTRDILKYFWSICQDYVRWCALLEIFCGLGAVHPIYEAVIVAADIHVSYLSDVSSVA